MGRLLLLLLAALCAAPVSSQEPAPSVEAQVATGIRQVQEGDFEGAVATLEAAAGRLKGDPQRVRLLIQAEVQLGVAHVALDHVAPAVQAFAEALALDPQLRLSPDRFSPKVLRAFETARAQAAQRPAAGGRSSRRTALLLGGGAAVAVAAGVVVAATAGGEAKPPTFTGARFGTPVLVCPDNSENLPLPFTILVEASNPDKQSVTINSVSTVVAIVAGTVANEIGFASNRPSTFMPTSIPGKQSVTVQVQSTLLCGNGPGDPGRFNEWSGSLTLTTSAGVFTASAADRMRVNIP